MKRNQLTVAVVAALGLQAPILMAQVPEIENAEPGIEIEEVFVLGEFVPQEKRDTSEISNVLDTEDLNFVPETNVGAALSRVAGLSLVGGKYVYVRGLGERYSSTLLNRARLSSPVPFQKTVPLDIVPNNIVKSLLVQKTYSVEYPGDFSGGVVDIRTKTTPDEDYLILKLATGGNSKTTGGDGLTYSGGKKDNWGFDDGTRAIPKPVQDLTTTEFDETVYPERANLGASFYDKWDIREKTMKPFYIGEAEFGKRLEFSNDMVLGFIGNYKYQNRWVNTDKDLRRYEFTGVEGGANQTVQYDRAITTQNIDISAFGSLGLELDENNSIVFNATKLRQTTDQVQQDKGLSSEDNVANGTQVESYLLQWAENQIESYQLTGSHYFPALNDALIEWRAVDGSGKRDAPDTRSYTYAEGNSGLMEMVTSSSQAAGDLRDVYQAPERNYSKLNDSINEYGLDGELPFTVLGIDSVVSAGISDYDRKRESADRLFRFDITNSAPDYVAWETPNQVFGDDNWIDEYVSVRDFSNSAANASGIYPYAKSSEKVEAYYLSLDSQVLATVRVQLGVRQEDTTIEADAWGGNTEPGTDNKVKRNYDDTLPALSVTWEFIENMQLRGAYSETVNRPSLLEVTGSTLRNPEDQNLYRGNVFLEPADLTNYDLRWEWYFGAADEMSLGAFYKEFDNPIELAKIQAQGDVYTWFNADKAELQGLEYDIRKELPLATWFDLDPVWDGFNLAFNVSYIDSKVTLLGSGETAADVPLTGGRQIASLYSNERKMTGQSDWLGNVQLSYVDYDLGITGSLLYNYTDERIILVGDNNAPDIIEEGRGVVDLLFKYEFAWRQSNLEIEAKAGNIFDTKIEWTQGDRPYENWQPGINYQLGLRVSF
ncbi:MAG: TonB-dependent receptor [Anaerolineae bacterium]|nr:TonB-dependent receptor [Anaerolineae bacterium]MCB1730252.1 TonB-dependent receptor [Halieaceae bacterium]